MTETAQMSPPDRLQQQLRDPAVTDALSRLLDRVDRIDRTLELLETTGPLIASAVDTFDGDVRRLREEAGIDLEERMRGLVGLVARLSEPRTLEVLGGLLDRIDLLEQFLEMADAAPGMVAMLVDSFDEMVRRAADAGVDIESIVRGLTSFNQKIARLAQEGNIDALVRSGVLDRESVEVVGTTGRALVASRHQPLEKTGILGLLRAARDEEVQVALGFLLTFARQFGQALARNGGQEEGT